MCNKTIKCYLKIVLLPCIHIKFIVQLKFIIQRLLYNVRTELTIQHYLNDRFIKRNSFTFNILEWNP
jgi:hypothetical protein